ncbi:5'-nucleotidase, lipoprotein e(P4) family [Streptococcus massiliensis]|uniref:Acid phosphatase n=1 Tax=Streptococcus massiliensis TaxID=313439 RepID=A0A380L269_9STRE|nr:5'-nucleotidase, lipoprotein e(P4) family [Streptococcus massiliensis]SUN76660.1 acid phosphatase [Streptococcus massiliensis]
MKVTKFRLSAMTVLTTAVLLVGCGQQAKESQTTKTETKSSVTLTYDQLRSQQNTMGTLWYQRSDEVKALYMQGYHIATERLKQLLQQPTDKPYSIVLDLDETVLDNSPYQVQNIKDGKAFDAASWDAWVQKAAAKPVAGAKEFLKYAADNGVQIYYISDRAANQVEATKKNLEEQGIPVQGKDHLMFLEKGVKSKEARRQKVRETTNLVMLFGDNLVDFADFSKTSETDRAKLLEELKNEFGEKFIIFPNPMYGSWESTVYKGEKLDAKGQIEKREAALQGYK